MTTSPRSLRFLIVPAAVVGLVTLFLAAAELWGPAQKKCAHQFPKIIGCVLGTYENLAGGLIGAGGALLAAWIAWLLIQKQTEVQRRSTQIADRTFWQNQANEAETALYGLTLVEETVRICLKEFDVPNANDRQKFLTALIRIQPTGVLNHSSFPPTGKQLIAWDLNSSLTKLRIAFDSHQKAAIHALPKISESIQQEAENLRKIAKRIHEARATYTADLKRAEDTLKALDTL